MLHQLQELKRNMPEKLRVMVANCYLLSKLSYGMPLFIGAKESTKRNITTCIMKNVRLTRQIPILNVNKKMCKSIKWDIPSQLIVKRALCSSTN